LTFKYGRRRHRCLRLVSSYQGLEGGGADEQASGFGSPSWGSTLLDLGLLRRGGRVGGGEDRRQEEESIGDRPRD
jgi:hypothetical protein